MNKKTVVVGDQFAEFATLEGAITVSKLANLFDGLTQDIAIPEAIMFGQGVSDSWLAYLKNRAQSRGLPTRSRIPGAVSPVRTMPGIRGLEISRIASIASGPVLPSAKR